MRTPLQVICAVSILLNLVMFVVLMSRAGGCY
ncbi:hypothetical protein ABIE91_003454 [Bradyrhizobium elkanii]